MSRVNSSLENLEKIMFSSHLGLWGCVDLSKTFSASLLRRLRQPCLCPQKGSFWLWDYTLILIPENVCLPMRKKNFKLSGISFHDEFMVKMQ